MSRISSPNEVSPCDILVQSRRDRRAAARFFRKLLKGQGREPRRLITDKLRSYSAAHRTVMPSVVHITGQYFSNTSHARHRENFADGSGSRDMKIER